MRVIGTLSSHGKEHRLWTKDEILRAASLTPTSRAPQGNKFAERDAAIYYDYVLVGDKTQEQLAVEYGLNKSRIGQIVKRVEYVLMRLARGDAMPEPHSNKDRNEQISRAWKERKTPTTMRQLGEAHGVSPQVAANVTLTLIRRSISDQIRQRKNLAETEAALPFVPRNRLAPNYVYIMQFLLKWRYFPFGPRRHLQPAEFEEFLGWAQGVADRLKVW